MAICVQYDDILKRMRRAALHANRLPDSVSLLAVSKTKTVEEIEPLLAYGHRLFAENRVQEARQKWEILKRKYPDAVLHLIGRLQTNKVKEAVALFDVIETVDGLELAERLAAEMKRQNRALPCFVQVNTGEEPQKGGVFPEQTVDFVRQCRHAGLNVVGLMCIPPALEEPSPHFALLKKLCREAGAPLSSMGMSADFEIAVEQSADFVRVGTALFGARA